MSIESVQLVVSKIWALYSVHLPILLFFAALFTLLSAMEFQSSTPGKRWWKNPGLGTDVSHFVVHALTSTYFKLPATLLIVLLLSGVMSRSEIDDYFAHGRGPLSSLPFWVQVPVFMLLSDLMLYWIHRIFHRSSGLWPFHAIHHSSKELDWTSSFRFHPINLIMQQSFVLVVMLAMGIRPDVIAFVMPFDSFLAAWQHSNSRTTLGPLKYVIATPVFHRWHHTLPEEGGDKNFAPTFAFWDLAFGSFYMPDGKLPENFGVDDPSLEEGYFNHLLYPLRRWIGTAAPESSSTPPS